MFFEHTDFVCATDAWFILCTNKIYTYVLKKSYFLVFPITKGSVNALMKLAGFSTSNKVNNHWFKENTECIVLYTRAFKCEKDDEERRLKKYTVTKY